MNDYKIFSTLICAICGVQWDNPSCKNCFYIHCPICGSGMVHDLKDFLGENNVC